MHRMTVTAGVAAVVFFSLLPAAARERSSPDCRGLAPTIIGTPGDDTLEGTPEADVIAGLGGDDLIRGKGGDDIVCGGPGADTIFGGAGDDVLKGGAGDDVVAGGTGADLLSGWSGADFLDGGKGNDRLLGHGGDDVLQGGDHDDVIRGAGGNDAARGGKGVDECRAEISEVCEMVALARGDSGWAVRYLQSVLADKKLYRGPIDGAYDLEVAAAVATFHKVVGPAYSNPYTAVSDWQGHPPSESMDVDDWRLLNGFAPLPPKPRTGQPDRVEVDIGHQVLYLIQDGDVDAIVHVSTGLHPNATPRTTSLPNGSKFWYKHPYDGWSPKPGGWSIYKFWAYRVGSRYNYGVHGYRSVPYYPASHGCTRVHVWEADYLHPRFFIGMPVHVWDE